MSALIKADFNQLILRLDIWQARTDEYKDVYFLYGWKSLYLPGVYSHILGIQLLLLYQSESLLNWCHVELIGAHIHKGDAQIFQGPIRLCTSMVRGIVKHKEGVRTPIAIYGVKITHEVNQKEDKGEAVSVSLTQWKVESSLISDCCRYTQAADLLIGRAQGGLMRRKPGIPAVVSELDDGLVDVDDVEIVAHALYKTLSCNLPLHLRLDQVVVRSYLVDLVISEPKTMLQDFGQLIPGELEVEVFPNEDLQLLYSD